MYYFPMIFPGLMLPVFVLKQLIFSIHTFTELFKIAFTYTNIFYILIKYTSDKVSRIFCIQKVLWLIYIVSWGWYHDIYCIVSLCIIPALTHTHQRCSLSLSLSPNQNINIGVAQLPLSAPTSHDPNPRGLCQFSLTVIIGHIWLIWSTGWLTLTAITTVRNSTGSTSSGKKNLSRRTETGLRRTRGGHWRTAGQTQWTSRNAQSENKLIRNKVIYNCN